MSATWFFTQFPPSRHGIENALRLAFWKAGYGEIWFSCTKDAPPYECVGNWHKQDFTIEWEPKNYLFLKMKDPDEELLDAFQRMVKHKALAAYKDPSGRVVVEWRVNDAPARIQELETAGAAELERLDH